MITWCWHIWKYQDKSRKGCHICEGGGSVSILSQKDSNLMEWSLPKSYFSSQQGRIIARVRSSGHRVVSGHVFHIIDSNSTTFMSVKNVEIRCYPRGLFAKIIGQTSFLIVGMLSVLIDTTGKKYATPLHSGITSVLVFSFLFWQSIPWHIYNGE
jgi:hypothetical protein